METKLQHLEEVRRQEASTKVEAVNVAIKLLREQQSEVALAYARGLGAPAEVVPYYDGDAARVAVQVCWGSAQEAYRAFRAAAVAVAMGAIAPSKLPKELPDGPIDLVRLADAANKAADEENGLGAGLNAGKCPKSTYCPDNARLSFESRDGCSVELQLDGTNRPDTSGVLEISAPTTQLVDGHAIRAAIAALTPF